MARIATFVSSHGFGHAARACAVMDALAARNAELHFEIFTTVPQWFFSSSLTAPFSWHDALTDVGFTQRSSLEEDPDATLLRLATLLPPSATTLRTLASSLRRRGCTAVIADISAVGLLAADAAALPSVLVENFTWDWVYDAYLQRTPKLAKYAAIIAAACATATLHIQTEPVCRTLPGARMVAPVSRRRRREPAAVRAALGVPPSAPLVLLTMGGIPYDFGALDLLRDHPKAWFVVPGGADRELHDGHLVALPHRSRHYHPDLVGAADLVLGKVGYSTVAEIAAASCSYAYLARPDFPESPILGAWAEEQLGARRIEVERLHDGSWLDLLPELLGNRRVAAGPAADGAAQAAELILAMLG